MKYILFELFDKNKNLTDKEISANKQYINEIKNKRTILTHVMIKNKTHLVAKLLENDADVNLLNPLFCAVDMDNIRLVKLFIKYGADINQIHNDMTPLSLACKNSLLPIYYLLIDNGANYKYIDSEKNTLLHCFDLFNNKHDLIICDDLLKKGLDINARNIRTSTPLIHAIYIKNYDFAFYLIRNGAIIEPECLEIFGSEWIFSDNKYAEMFELLLLVINRCPRFFIEFLDNEFEKIEDILYDYIKTNKLYILNVKTELNKTPLSLAISNSHDTIQIKLAKFLIYAGADYDDSSVIKALEYSKNLENYNKVIDLINAKRFSDIRQNS